MGFGQNFLKGFFGADGLKDYDHASKTFRSNQYELSPRLKFLYHVYFTINVGQIPSLQKVFGNGDQATIGLMVKSIQLPSYQMKVETLNQYNRKRQIQTQIDYQPVQVVFNDDQGDLIRNMWYNYYSYYYKDPTQKYDSVPNQDGTLGQLQTQQNASDYNSSDIYSPNRVVNDWGFIGESYSDGTSGVGQVAGVTGTGKPPFFRDIKIYGMSQKKFASYVLINPLITDWQGDTYEYAQGDGVMQNTMTIKYETVKYYTGDVGGAQPSNTVNGFADPAHYDIRKSALARPGASATVFGQGGLLDAGAGAIEDLQAGNFIGAFQKAGTAYNTSKNMNISGSAAAELKQGALGAAAGLTTMAAKSAANLPGGTGFPLGPKKLPPG